MSINYKIAIMPTVISLWVISTDLRPSSVKISVNWLIYLRASVRVPSWNLQVEPFFSSS